MRLRLRHTTAVDLNVVAVVTSACMWVGCAVGPSSVVSEPARPLALVDTNRPAFPPERYFFPEDTAWSVIPPYDTTVRYHRTLYAIVFDDSTSGLRIHQLFGQYQATIIAGYSHTHAYAIRVPDPGPSWTAVDSLLHRLRSEAGVNLVFPLNFREPGTLHR